MEKRIITHKRFILILFGLFAVISACMTLGTSVNYNIIDYLPADAPSTKGLSVMNEEFTQAVPNARVMLNDVSVPEALEYKHRLQEIDGVSDVLWLDDVMDISIPIETADPKVTDSYYKDGDALISLTVRGGDEIEITDEIYALIGEDNALEGDAADKAAIQKLTNNETLKSILILVPIIILILLLSTDSWFEPVLFLGAIGISVLINMGTNLLYGEVSFITNAVSPILQLAVSLDYAIFLLHSFSDMRKKTDDVNEAMRLAMRRAFPAIAASAATTVFGFLALVFMRFEIGSDLGINLVKGVVLSFISVMVFLPALTLCCFKLIDKTKHRRIIPATKSVGKYILRFRIPALILIAALIIPCFLAQNNNAFTYGLSELDPNGRSGQDSIIVNDKFGESNVIVLLTPVGDAYGERQLADTYRAMPHVDEVISYATMVGTVVPDEYPDSADTDRFFSEHYRRMVLYTDIPKEGAEAFSFVEQLQKEAQEVYGDDWHMIGMSANLYDMKDVVTQDNDLVNILAIVAIAFVLLITFRSLSLPVLLVLTIKSAIWINLSVSYFMGNSLAYIGYLIISTVQLGATVDYAILLSDHYMQNRKQWGKKEALKRALNGTAGSIFVSGSILSLAGFALWFASSNPIVSALGLLLGRGAILSMLLVICFLPALLTLFDRVLEKTTLRARFHKDKETRKAQ
ncbi:MAG: MMPL family transporter [Clostridiales Family XIII bacterium]|jgi:predicted RND superfamily exporter protein|nr:MMPL family transporter [Clostridiales Family XIII bacterium]